jgi:hypothetical protein
MMVGTPRGVVGCPKCSNRYRNAVESLGVWLAGFFVVV